VFEDAVAGLSVVELPNLRVRSGAVALLIEFASMIGTLMVIRSVALKYLLPPYGVPPLTVTVPFVGAVVSAMTVEISVKSFSAANEFVATSATAPS